MKWIVIIFLAFVSCKRCADCNRTWVFQSYRLNNSGVGYTAIGNPVKGTDETLDICGNDAIDNAENLGKTTTPTPEGYIEGTSTTVCVDR